MDTNDKAQISDSVEVEVKGPGKQWKWRDQVLLEEEAARAEGVEAIDYEVKGPGPEWETNEKGEFINRDEDE